MFYVGCHKLTTTTLLYPGSGQAVNSALAELCQRYHREMYSSTIYGQRRETFIS